MWLRTFFDHKPFYPGKYTGLHAYYPGRCSMRRWFYGVTGPWQPRRAP